MSLQIQSQPYKNQPAFGCGTCQIARQFLLDDGVPQKVARAYTDLLVPATGKNHFQEAQGFLRKVVNSHGRAEVLEDIQNKLQSGELVAESKKFVLDAVV